MLRKLGLPTTLLLLVLLFPAAAQSSRGRLLQQHHQYRQSLGHHYNAIKASSPATNELLSEYQHRRAHPHIQMATMKEEAARTHYQSIKGLDTPVSGPNLGGNPASPATTNQLLAHNEHNLGDMLLHKRVAGPNSGGNNQVLSASLQKILAPDRRSNSKTQKRSLIGAKSAQISLNSAQLVGASLELNSIAAKDSIFSMLPRAHVPPSGPSKDHNSVITSRNLFEEEAENPSI